MAMDRRRMGDVCRSEAAMLERLLARQTSTHEVMLAVLELSPSSRGVLVRILRRVAEIEAARGADAAEAAVRRVIAVFGRRIGAAAH